ncbi:hypothetical protein M422DRAFT_780541 [Sphaerobolus stellatus SS14]|uniref:Palmitoyltransferase n=1 Tax=Sphaerobolus stellatus (strain SS14) TaxID=990650 RepID=A0A0C9V293_SPHS4|nr:hypothetical protein M422DRAFT_780541 [Sphaerobolus stellatus SS14]
MLEKDEKERTKEERAVESLKDRYRVIIVHYSGHKGLSQYDKAAAEKKGLHTSDRNIITNSAIRRPTQQNCTGKPNPRPRPHPPKSSTGVLRPCTQSSVVNVYVLDTVLAIELRPRARPWRVLELPQTHSEDHENLINGRQYENGYHPRPIRLESRDEQARPRKPPAAHLRGGVPGQSPGSPPSMNVDLPPPAFSRHPPTHPVLAPEACGTCVLKYDHHCPWIGQCVGMWNHKFFINFLMWSPTFTLYVFLSVLILLARRSPTSPDPQQIVIIALAGFFAIFMTTLFLTQSRFVFLNMTTIEQLHAQRMHEREKAILSDLIPCPCTGLCGEGVGVAGRKRIKEQWDVEWGKEEKEGNLWWSGSQRENWEQVMGRILWGGFGEA